MVSLLVPTLKIVPGESLPCAAAQSGASLNGSAPVARSNSPEKNVKGPTLRPPGSVHRHVEILPRRRQVLDAVEHAVMVGEHQAVPADDAGPSIPAA